VASEELPRHCCWAFPHITGKDVREEHPRQDQGVKGDGLGLEEGIDLLKGWDVITHNIVAPQLVCLQEKGYPIRHTVLTTLVIETEDLFGIQIHRNNAMDNTELTQQAIGLTVKQ
jgi:hypothetical protein